MLSTVAKWFGVMVPVVRTRTLISGVATAVIIAATTLNYTFVGISILFALLLMRGGVLILAPIVDTFLGRRVDIVSWVALGFSFLALAIAFAEVGGYQMTLVAGLNIAAYLVGYCNSHSHHDEHRQVQEFRNQPPILPRRDSSRRCGPYRHPGAVRADRSAAEILARAPCGVHHLLRRSAGLSRAVIGVLYGCLYVFGTGIYLDHRENTYCIPLNRCSSLLSGLFASFGLTCSSA